MSTPKTRIPACVRAEVRFALECWRDYLLAIGNKNGASAAQDVAKVLGLEELTASGVNRFTYYYNNELRQMLKNIERYGAR